MYRRWRPAADDFRPSELLYRRYRREDTKNGVILDAALPSPRKVETTGPSVNRERFSRPEDTLWTDTGKLDGLGVFQFPVSCLPRDITCATTARRFAFMPKHVPLTKNYAHSELWCDEVPTKNAGYVVPTKLVWKEVRATIQKNSQIVITATL
jgi:hypothetical protein